VLLLQSLRKHFEVDRFVTKPNTAGLFRIQENCSLPKCKFLISAETRFQRFLAGSKYGSQSWQQGHESAGRLDSAL